MVTKPDGTLGFDYDRPQSIGRVRAFYGNFGMSVRALAYMLANGPEGLRQTTEDAVLNANYIRKAWKATYDLPYSSPACTSGLHRQLQAKKGVQTMDHRQAPDRLRLPSLHDGVSADRARRADDRAHRKRVQRRAGFCSSKPCKPLRKRSKRTRNRADRAALHPRRAPRRNCGCEETGAALEAKRRVAIQANRDAEFLKPRA